MSATISIGVLVVVGVRLARDFAGRSSSRSSAETKRVLR